MIDFISGSNILRQAVLIYGRPLGGENCYQIGGDSDSPTEYLFCLSLQPFFAEKKRRDRSKKSWDEVNKMDLVYLSITRDLVHDMTHWRHKIHIVDSRFYLYVANDRISAVFSQRTEGDGFATFRIYNLLPNHEYHIVIHIYGNIIRNFGSIFNRKFYFYESLATFRTGGVIRPDGFCHACCTKQVGMIKQSTSILGRAVVIYSKTRIFSILKLAPTLLYKSSSKLAEVFIMAGIGVDPCHIVDHSRRRDDDAPHDPPTHVPRRCHLRVATVAFYPYASNGRISAGYFSQRRQGDGFATFRIHGLQPNNEYDIILFKSGDITRDFDSVVRNFTSSLATFRTGGVIHPDGFCHACYTEKVSSGTTTDDRCINY